MDDAPAKGGSASSKRVSLLDMNALLSHGAVANIRDSGIIRGQRNEDLWLQFMQGYNPTQVKVPKAYEKFVHQLQASGINVVPKGGQLQIMAVTNDDVEQWSGGRTITNGDTVDFVKGAMPVKGGLFDPQLTGGHGGCFHPAVTVLAENGPIPNGEKRKPRNGGKLQVATSVD